MQEETNLSLDEELAILSELETLVAEGVLGKTDNGEYYLI